jgi:hypothetical protein
MRTCKTVRWINTIRQDARYEKTSEGSLELVQPLNPYGETYEDLDVREGILRSRQAVCRQFSEDEKKISYFM